MSPLCEHVGSLFDDVDRHDHHSDGTYPLAHYPLTTLYVSGPVRFPLGLRFYRRYEELTQWEAAVVLVTNRVDWSAAKIIGLYLHRWPTETFDQDSPGHLDFDAYRMRSIEALGKHWCVVFVAYSLLYWTCLPAVPDRT